MNDLDYKEELILEVNADLHKDLQVTLKKVIELEGNCITDGDTYQIDIEEVDNELTVKLSIFDEDGEPIEIILDDDLVTKYALPKIIEAMKKVEWNEL